jgi:ammonia channel protein AmtB
VTPDPKLITPSIVGVFAAWGIFRRVRWAFGRHPVRVRRIWFRIGALALIGGFVLATNAARNVDMRWALVIGIVGGAVLAYVGLRHTRFEVTREGQFYTPHTYMGLLVTALFFGRMLYRFLYLSSSGTHPLYGAHRILVGSYQRSPLTLGILAALVAYYVLFYLGVLARTRAPELTMRASPRA